MTAAVLLGIVGARVASMASDPDAVAVRGTVLRGEVLRQQASVVPAGYLGGPMAPALKAAKLNDVQSRLSSVFSSALVQEVTATLSAGLDKSAAADPVSAKGPYPVVVQDGGAKAVDYSALMVNGSKATVTADVETWLTISQVRGGVVYPAHPHNVIILKESLEKQADGHWMIVARDFTFAPGQAP